MTPLTKMILDSESVSFVGDQAVFEDENQAKQAISSVVQTLLAHRTIRYMLSDVQHLCRGKKPFVRASQKTERRLSSTN